VTTDFKTTPARLTALTLAVGLALGATVSSAPAQEGPGRMPPAFGDLDTDGDGAITRSDLEAFAEGRFAAADTDGDGVLSEAELTARAAERGAARVTRMLNRLDADGDGALSRAEIEARGGRHGGDRAGRMLERADTDGDGAVSETEYAGILQHMAEHRGMGRGPGMGHGRHQRDHD
jgi:Ca2+-binding EF-hand superfamily protein